MEPMMHAASISLARSRDPDIELPVRPRLCAGLVVIETDRGLLIEGAPERQWLTGDAATTLLPRLLELLDGTLDDAELARALAAPIRHVRSAIALLYARGVLEQGGDARSEDEADI